MDLVVAFAKLVISKEEIPIADRTLSPSVCMFSHKRLIAKIEAIMMIRGINFTKAGHLALEMYLKITCSTND